MSDGPVLEQTIDNTGTMTKNVTINEGSGSMGDLQ